MQLTDAERGELAAIVRTVKMAQRSKDIIADLPSFLYGLERRLESFLNGEHTATDERFAELGANLAAKSCIKWPSTYHYVKDAYCHVSRCKYTFDDCMGGKCPIATLRAYAAHDIDELRHLRAVNAILLDALAPVFALHEDDEGKVRWWRSEDMADAIRKCLDAFYGKAEADKAIRNRVKELVEA